MFRNCYALRAWLYCHLLVLYSVQSAAATISVLDAHGNKVAGYNASHALLVGVSDYTAGWPDLETIPGELKQVELALSSQGFTVTKVLNPTSIELMEAYRQFIAKYGFDGQNRLLFYFSGHGHTRHDGQRGYLVPTDAPDPQKDETAFLSKALSMEQILAWARQIEAKHALFLFDSCFSGSIFKTKSAPMPSHISGLTAQPVRQFITAGNAGEQVPAESVFTPAFIDAIRFGLADADKDGYITGTELGLYLQTRVPEHAQQSPQFGKINDYELSRGDFVFLAGGDVTQTLATDQAEPILLVESSPPGAQILVGGETPIRGIAPLRLNNLKTSRMHVSAFLEGYQPYERDVDVVNGQQTRITIVLEPITQSLQLRSTPAGADWYLDGALAGKTPANLGHLSAGKHRIEVRLTGYKSWARDIVATTASALILEANLIPAPTEFKLTVNTQPPQATVRIKNTPAVYRAGMSLPAGKYDLEIAAPGFQATHTTADLSQGDQVLSIALSRLSAPIVSKIPGTVFADTLPSGDDGPEMIVIPPGTFTMGSRQQTGYVNDEQPHHPVTIGKAFAVGRYEVTFKHYDAFAVATNRPQPSDNGFGRDDRPALNIAWQDAHDYAAWLAEQTGARYRLLTEAEWEYVARGGSRTAFWWGDSMELNRAKCTGCTDGWSKPGPEPVGAFAANGFGLHDTVGNVWEWVEDCYHNNYRGAPANGRAWVTTSCARRVLRGGAWNTRPELARSSERGAENATPNAIGFRVARDL